MHPVRCMSHVDHDVGENNFDTAIDTDDNDDDDDNDGNTVLGSGNDSVIPKDNGVVIISSIPVLPMPNLVLLYIAKAQPPAAIVPKNTNAPFDLMSLDTSDQSRSIFITITTTTTIIIISTTTTTKSQRGRIQA